MKLLRHLKSDEPSDTVTSYKIRPFWLQGTHLPNIVSCHILDPTVERLLAVQALGLKHIEWLIRTQMAGQITPEQNTSVMSVHTKKRRTRSARLNRYQRLPLSGPSFLANQTCQLLNSWCVKKNSYGKILSHHLF